MRTCLIAAALICASSLHLVAEEQPAVPAPPQPATKEPSVTTRIIIDTSMGQMTAELDADKAPITVSNFLGYVDAKFYDGTIFHRVMKGFMIQGGGFTPDMRQKATQPMIKNEAVNGLKNDRGTLSMARTGNPDSATSQFFINHVDNKGLNRPNPDGHGYAVFGKVTEGLDVLDAIAAVPTGQSGPHGNVPQKAVMINSIRRAPAAATKAP